MATAVIPTDCAKVSASPGERESATGWAHRVPHPADWGSEMDGFDVTTELGHTTGDAVSDTGLKLNSEITQMNLMLGDLSLAWSSSEAAPRFVSAMEGHLANATILKDALISHGSSLVTAGIGMAGTESALSDGMPVVS